MMHSIWEVYLGFKLMHMPEELHLAGRSQGLHQDLELGICFEESPNSGRFVTACEDHLHGHTQRRWP